MYEVTENNPHETFKGNKGFFSNYWKIFTLAITGKNV